MEYIAHIRERDGQVQTVHEHLYGVKKYAELYGAKIGLKHLAGLSGMLHDLGKNTARFKKYIQDAVANPDNPPPKGSVDHSSAGGKLLYQEFYRKETNALEKLTVEWLAMCIISHHSGLRDFITPELSSDFLYRVSEKELPEYEDAVSVFFQQNMSKTEFEAYFKKAKNEAANILKKIREHNLKPITLSLVIKYIFSCLIEADRTNSRLFEENMKEEKQNEHTSFFNKCYEVLTDKISAFNISEDAVNPINLLRSEMSNQCDKFAHNPSGIYTLSIPTGGGKTLASLRYALRHALEFKKERIIYVVPYTTIIEQNAAEVRNVLKNDHDILEHHSNVIEENGTGEDYDLINKKLMLAKDNWDSPIIFTTMVQFLNVFYSKGTRNVRRLHNLANSILIFDEVQSVPIKCISLFNEALNFLNIIGKSSIVLCTATQPALNFVKNKLKISTDAEIITDINKVSKSFKRVNVIDKTRPQRFDAVELREFILTKMRNVKNVLVILNTKTAVRKLFEQLNIHELRENYHYEVFHLSTSMCPTHRQEVLSRVREALQEKKRIICVSTQLIEAGVDISFECVIRSLAGLDSIAQAAGRCNRHGEYGLRNVYIINSADEVLTKLKEIRIGGEQTERILKEFKTTPEHYGEDLLSTQAINQYFQYYYHQISIELDYPILPIQKNLYDLVDHNQDYYTAFYNKNKVKFPLICRQSFATAEKYFQVIDNLTTSIIVPYNNEAKRIISDLNGEFDIQHLGALLRKAQQYIINVYKHELEILTKENYVDSLLHGNILALKEVAYTETMGLDLEGDGNWSIEVY